MTIEELTEAVAAGFIPDDPDQLRATMEGLPAFWTVLAASLGALSEWASAAVGEKTGAAIGDLAAHTRTGSDFGTEAFLCYQDDASAWHET